MSRVHCEDIEEVIYERDLLQDVLVLVGGWIPGQLKLYNV